MIIRIAGTSGSGKSTLVRTLLHNHVHQIDHWPEDARGKRKIRGYRVWPDQDKLPIYVVGRYDVVTGGADSSFNKAADGRNSMERLDDEIRDFAGNPALRAIIFEGLIVSSVWGRWERMAQQFPMAFAFLDTPLAVCKERVLERNGGKQVKWDNLEQKYRTCLGHMQKARDAGLVVRVLRHQHALEDLERLLDERS